MKKLILSLFLSTLSLFSFAEERILHFDAEAVVNKDGSVDITEDITVKVEHYKIHKGLYRDIPTKLGEEIKVKGLLFDNEPHPYFTEGLQDGLRINFGNDDDIEQGIHTYRFTYKISGMVKPFKEYDELYWNVTGNDWAFAIQNAFGKVKLPPNVKVLEDKISIYTGRSGEKGQDAIRNNLLFMTTRPLNAKQGMTVAVPFEKGYIDFPFIQKMWAMWALYSEIYDVVAWCVVAIMAVWGFFLWWRNGKDPTSRVVRRLEPPSVSPALTKSIVSMNDRDCLSVVFTSLSMKGALSIFQNDSSVLLSKNEFSEESLSEEEKLVYQSLPSEIEITGSYDKKVESLSIELWKNLEQQTQKKYFYKNTGLWWGRLFIFIYLLLCYSGFCVVIPFLLAIALTFFCWVGMLCFSSDITSLIRRPRFSVHAILSLFFLAFFAFGLQIGMLKSSFVICSLVFCIGLAIYWVIMPSYTVFGRAIMDEIEGFKEYLLIGEKGRLEMTDPTDELKIFCDYLPYALALDIENKWIESFEKILSEAQIKEGLQSRGFVSSDTLSSSLSSFSSSVSTSSSPPSSGSGGGCSGSGSGGGGCSGGGSGGGGGGGR